MGANHKLRTNWKSANMKFRAFESMQLINMNIWNIKHLAKINLRAWKTRRVKQKEICKSNTNGTLKTATHFASPLPANASNLKLWWSTDTCLTSCKHQNMWATEIKRFGSLKTRTPVNFEFEILDWKILRQLLSVWLMDVFFVNLCCLWYLFGFNIYCVTSITV